ncbi:PGN_0703 family putative restriction endonuclease [Knoellia sp. CPCC 206435]|uniref:PGN_0703 family putative restriction endonuclease n=1 Tax=Knoellia terrae TaxID=3404797 RepID=UPI003B432D19
MRGNEYVVAENQKLVAWKRRTPALPHEAREPGVYVAGERPPTRPLDICVPPKHAPLNLLPNVRSEALALFRELDIPWHDGVDEGPSNHLRDSQVQCVNALHPMVRDAHRIQAAFGHLLDIADVLPIEADRYLTFEYIGHTDYFGEGRGKARRRGTMCTSVDAAFTYRTSRDVVELALVEWKYTETYPTARRESSRSDAARRRAYEPDVTDENGPLNGSWVPFDVLLNEPFYQLVRQQLLAHRLEQDPHVAADVVRVVHVLSPDNTAYQACLHDFARLELGASVDEVWTRLLRRPDRFLHLDPAVFLNPSITSVDYVDRYGDALLTKPNDGNVT